MRKINFIFAPLLLLLLAGCEEKKSEQKEDQAHELQQASSGPEKEALQNTKDMSEFHHFQLESLDGEKIDFSQYQGKKVLLVNVASECGYTPQYGDLQALHTKFGDKLVVLGFPANNFGNQEPGSAEEIADFCQKNYGVDFQMFSKISVKGNDQHPLYSWLREKTGQEPAWNFSKYLVDEKGEVLAFYPSDVKPLDPQIVDKIEK